MLVASTDDLIPTKTAKGRPQDVIDLELLETARRRLRHLPDVRRADPKDAYDKCTFEIARAITNCWLSAVPHEDVVDRLPTAEQTRIAHTNAVPLGAPAHTYACAR